VDELSAAKDRILSFGYRGRSLSVLLVLPHPGIPSGGLPTDTACAVLARDSRNSAGHGLPLLSLIRGGFLRVECTHDSDLHELPHPGAIQQPKIDRGKGQLANGEPG
jgi:hypothetical protein